jgi:hypothetical protein
VAVATDHVIESFRNRLWHGYKTGAGVDPDLLAQFQLLEDSLTAMGVVVWPMVEFEADDALAAAAVRAAADPRVDRVVICTPDKDLAQCVQGTRVVQLNRRTRTTFDEAGVVTKFGVPPASIPDYLALVGDAADGYPGLKGWGAKSTAACSPFRPHRRPGRSSGSVNATTRVALRGHARQSPLPRSCSARWPRSAPTPTFDTVDELEWRGRGPNSPRPRPRREPPARARQQPQFAQGPIQAVLA